jgi:hypothetical protein
MWYVQEDGSAPRPVVAFAWGSRSMMRMRFPSSAREDPKLMAVVVFPTPPFWFEMLIIFWHTMEQYHKSG